MLYPLPLLFGPARVRLGLCDPFLGLDRDGHGGQLGEPEPHALVADRRPDRLVRPLCRPEGGRRHRDGWARARVRRAPASRREWPKQKQIQ